MAQVAGASASSGSWRSLGGFIDEDFAWHIPVARERLSSIVDTFGLEPVALNRVPRQFFEALPGGWPPERQPGDLAYQTPGFVSDQRGDDGTFLFAYWDSRRGEIYVWDKQNF